MSESVPSVQVPGLESLQGKNIFIRTVTSYFTGRLVGITANRFIVLEDAAWISVTGRFGTMLVEGPTCINELEPYPADLPVYVNEASVVDWCEWRHKLPRDQK